MRPGAAGGKGAIFWEFFEGGRRGETLLQKSLPPATFFFVPGSNRPAGVARDFGVVRNIVDDHRTRANDYAFTDGNSGHHG